MTSINALNKDYLNWLYEYSHESLNAMGEWDEELALKMYCFFECLSEEASKPIIIIYGPEDLDKLESLWEDNNTNED